MVALQDTFIGPPTFPPSDNAMLQAKRETVVNKGLNPSIVIVLTLGAFLLAGFLWLYFSPLTMKKKLKPAPAPIDLENAYFTDKNETRSFSPYTYDVKPLPCNYRDYRLSTTKSASSKIIAQWLKAQSAWTTTTNTEEPFTPPPPAYCRHPNSSSTRTAPLPIHTIPSLLYLPGTAYNSNPRARRRPTVVPRIKITRTPSTRTISKPIPHPDGPLPGPRMSMDPEPRNESNTSLLRPSAAPSKPVSSSTNHPPPAYLPTPSKTVVHTNTDICSTPQDAHDHDSNRRFLSDERFSHFFAEWDQKDDAETSISSSRIGIAI